MQANMDVWLAISISFVLIAPPVSGGELLVNSGFEVGSGEVLNPYGLTGWVGYGNQEKSSQFMRAGSASLKMFGGAGCSGLYQVVPLSPGRRLHAIAHFFTPSNDPISGTARAGIRIEFLGTDLNRTESYFVDATTPAQSWILFEMQIDHPAAVGVGRFAILLSDGGASEGSTYWDAAGLWQGSNSSQNLLSSGGFDFGEGGLGNPNGLDGWVAFGNAELSHEWILEGAAALKLFGGFTYSGIFQGFRYEPGNSLSLSLRFMTPTTDAIGGTASAGISIEWPGPMVGIAEQLDIDGDIPRDEWIRRELIANPPEGAIAARLVFSFEDGGSPGGAIFVDDVSLLPILPGDTDGNGRVDGRDVQDFVHAVIAPGRVAQSALLAADIGGLEGDWMPDEHVTLEDVQAFVALLLGG